MEKVLDVQSVPRKAPVKVREIVVWAFIVIATIAVSGVAAISKQMEDPDETSAAALLNPHQVVVRDIGQ